VVETVVAGIAVEKKVQKIVEQHSQNTTSFAFASQHTAFASLIMRACELFKVKKKSDERHHSSATSLEIMKPERCFSLIVF
jgi:hypothetical protein